MWSLDGEADYRALRWPEGEQGNMWCDRLDMTFVQRRTALPLGSTPKWHLLKPHHPLIGIHIHKYLEA
jgi:hypothetical protein